MDPKDATEKNQDIQVEIHTTNTTLFIVILILHLENQKQIQGAIDLHRNHFMSER